MSNSVFTNWTSAARHLNEKIKNNQLIAGRNIRLENTGNGIRINGLANNTPGDTYKGYFKVIQTAANKIKIVDGMDIEAAICGKVNVNYFPKNVAVIEFTITENCFIYLECELVGSPAATEATAVIIKSNTELESEAGTYRDLISRVKFAAPVAPATVGSISDFNREPVSTNVIMAGDCG